MYFSFTGIAPAGGMCFKGHAPLLLCTKYRYMLLLSMYFKFGGWYSPGSREPLISIEGAAVTSAVFVTAALEIRGE